MKNSLLSFIIIVFVVLSCNQKKDKTNPETTSEITEQLYACPMHPEITGKKGDTCSVCGMELTKPVAEKETTDTIKKSDATITDFSNTSTKAFSIDVIVNDYLKLKNALIKDDTKSSATAGKELYTTFNLINTNLLNAKLKKEYLEIAESAKENAEHIGDNAGKLDHQREHFVFLSKDINDLIKTFGTKQKLYQDFCPMANEGKGAIWISETKAIKNPYYGADMLSCGSVKKEL